MTRLFKLPLVLLVILSPMLSSCDAVKSFDDIQPGTQGISPDQALGTIQGYEALVLSVYDYLQNNQHYGSYYILRPDALADNIIIPAQTANRLAFEISNNRGAHVSNAIYGLAYSAINEANLILDGVDGIEIEGATEAAATAQRNRLKGEAYFLRALNYFDLVRGLAYEPGREVGGFDLGVVIRTEPTRTLEEAEPLPRSTNVEVYAQIISDLEQAATLLANNSRGGVQFASRPAALALLARAHLYAGNLDRAATIAQQAIDVSGVALVTDDGDSENGNEILTSWTNRQAPPESIFTVQLEQGNDGGSTNGNDALQAITDPTVSGISFDAVVTEDLIAAYSDGDARRALIATTGGGIDYMQKYTGTTSLYVDWSPVIRLPELYYIIAEARALQGDASGAYNALNVVRNARGLDDLDSGDAVDAVLLERRLEFAFEGHRFFDLKRRGRTIPKPQVLSADIPYTDFRILSPIPFGEIDTNPALTQNPGY